MKIGITETVLRDANQSLIATRMSFEDFEGILEAMDNAGYASIECWGGCNIRFMSEIFVRGPMGKAKKNKAESKEDKTSDASEGAEPVRLQTLS